jgi:formamidopyrimidine-DNA glycosylase
MPELPEVETVKLGLNKLLPGLTVKAVTHDWANSFPNADADVKKFLIGAKIKNVRRRAKVLMIDLSSEHSLVIHLKMTGQLVFVGEPTNTYFADRRSYIGEEKNQSTNYDIQSTTEPTARFGAGHPTKSLIGELPDRSTRVTITFIDGGQLFFNDQRKFGWMRLMPTNEIMNIDFMKKVGPEPLEQNFLAKNFIERLYKRQNSNIKAVLLDQSVIAGVGNIYADESLFAAGIHPASIVKAVPKKKLELLYQELRRILQLSIKNGGTTDRNYVDALGRRGNYMDMAKVFRREKQPCLTCQGEIIKIRVAGRGTHICLKCQKLYKVRSR